MTFSGRLLSYCAVLSLSASIGFSQLVPLSRPELSAKAKYGELPLAFEPNQGQSTSDVRYLARARGFTALLSEHGATLVLGDGRPAPSQEIQALGFSLVGASWEAAPQALEKQPGVTNYLLGANPSKWRTEIPNFSRVLYANAYPGIDLIFYGNHRQLEHDFIVKPGVDYSKIRVRIDGARSLTTNSEGQLLVTTPSGTLTFAPPHIYQIRNNLEQTVAGRYKTVASNDFAFELGTYDPTLPVVIDPILSYSTYLAGSTSDVANAITVDGAGNAYIAGYTLSTDFPVKRPATGACVTGCPIGNAFITKLNPTGTALVYSTIVGGSAEEQAKAVAVDSLGNVAVVGYTTSFDFPQKNGLAVVLSAYSSHGFAFSLTPAGTAFNFSTYLGGQSTDSATGVAFDADGNVYVSGTTDSANFRVTPGNQIGSEPAQYSNTDIFTVKLARRGKLVWSTLIGGSTTGYFYGTFTSNFPVAIAVDPQGQPLLAGAAYSGFPTTPGAFQPQWPSATSQTSGFLAKLNASGSSILYGTYLGGSLTDQITQLTQDILGNVYVTGATSSTDFPVTPGAFQTSSSNTGQVAFIAKIDPTLSSLIYSTYLGGVQNEYTGTSGVGIAMDSNGNAVVSGNTNSANFPLVSPLVSQLPRNPSGYSNSAAFLSVLNAAGSNLVYSTLFSGTYLTQASGLALDLNGDPYITGTTQDADLPTTPGAFQRSVVSVGWPQQHAFVTKFSLSQPNAAACLSSTSLFFGSITGAPSFPDPLTIQNCGTLPLKISGITTSNPAFTFNAQACQTIAPSASCTLNIRYVPAAGATYDIGTLQIQDNAPVSQVTVQLNGSVLRPDINIYQYYSLGFGDQVVGVPSIPTRYAISTSFGLPLHITGVSTTGPFTATTNCPKALQVNQSCSLILTFTPTAVGPVTGSVLVYDDAPDSPQSMQLGGNGIAAYPAPVISYVYPSSVPVGSNAVQAYVAGTGFYAASTLLVNGAPFTGKITSGNGSMQFMLPKALFAKMGEVSIQVVNPSPGGASNVSSVTIYHQTNLGAADVVYEPFSQKFYASIPASSSVNPNTLVTIDPSTGKLGTPIPIGNDPGALGISDDGKMLYVGLNGDHTILPFNLRTQTAGSKISLPTDPQRGTLNAIDIQVQPGHPENAVITLGLFGYGASGQDGLVFLTGGKLTSTFLNTPPNNVAVQGTAFTDSSNLYGWQNYYSGGMLHFVVSGDQLLEAPGFPATYSLGAFATDGINFFDVNGEVLDPKTGNVLTDLGIGTSSGVLRDPSSGRVFFVGNGQLFVVDPTTFARVATGGGPSGSTDRIVKWGLDGLAYLTANQSNFNVFDLVQLRSKAFYSVPGPYALPSVTAVSPSRVATGGGNFVLTVSGSQFVPGSVVRWNGQNRTTTFVNSSTLTADIPYSDISVAGGGRVVVVNPTPGGGTSNAARVTIQ